MAVETMNLVQLAEDRSYEALEGAWLTAVDEGLDGDASQFIAAADVLASQNEPERAATLLGLVVPALKATGHHAEAVRVLRRAVALAARPDDLRAELVEC